MIKYDRHSSTASSSNISIKLSALDVNYDNRKPIFSQEKVLRFSAFRNSALTVRMHGFFISTDTKYFEYDESFEYGLGL